LKAEKFAYPDAYATSVREAEEAVPSDAELVEALRLLTPATGYFDASQPSSGMLVAAGQLAQQAARNAPSGPRWMAEPMTLSAEESGILLEAEMIRTLELQQVEAMSPNAEEERGSQVSAIATAVESRLAASEPEASEGSLAKFIDGKDSNQNGSSNPSNMQDDANQMASGPETMEAVQGNLVAKDSAAGDLAAGDQPATFADAVSENAHHQEPSGSSQNREPMDDDPNQELGMALASIAEIDPVEAKNRAELKVDDAPRAMAAAASAESSASLSDEDARKIASIVDSVMADLRPRIVEEITRKLAEK
jgi:hypothetical protein